jgi:hypothetical protein
MPDNSEFKALVRKRMDITGESYTQTMRPILEAASAAVPNATSEGFDGSLADFIAEGAGPVQRRPEWGPWDIDRERCVLWTAAPGVRYEVRLEECASSAGALFWIAQIAGKTWGRTPAERSATLSGFVIALDELLALQENLCGVGRDGQILSTDEIRRLVREGHYPA